MLAVLNVIFSRDLGSFPFGMSWGVAISVVATAQLLAAIWLRSELPAVFKGPRERRVVWDVPREQVDEPGWVRRRPG